MYETKIANGVWPAGVQPCLVGAVYCKPLNGVRRGLFVAWTKTVFGSLSENLNCIKQGQTDRCFLRAQEMD
jgi:hypothetical protein